ncbi:MAG: ATP-binding protein [bacterium]
MTAAITPLRLEEVFKTSGIPTHTFVKPQEYDRLLVALRTPGQGVVIEGPSGIGKTTAVTKVLEELGDYATVTTLSARRPGDLSIIQQLTTSAEPLGTVIIDDFHRLPQADRERLTDLVKFLADKETSGTKLVLVGINKTGESMITFMTDVASRLEIIRFEANPRSKVWQLVKQGEQAMSVAFTMSQRIVEAAHGSFYIAQLLCREACLEALVLRLNCRREL